MGEHFIDYLTTEKRLNPNTASRYIKFVKTVIFFAEKIELDISKNIRYIKPKINKVSKHTLSIEELNLIKATKMPTDSLETSKDWLVLGCFVEQRVSDLLRMDKSMIQVVSGHSFIVLEQVKTKKVVQIPIHDEVQKILNKNGDNYPKKIGKNSTDGRSALFNRQIKQVCKLLGIDEPINDYLFCPIEKRKIKTAAPKWKFVTSHICRRSFATNFHGKIPTPLLINVTAHSSEALFLELYR